MTSSKQASHNFAKQLNSSILENTRIRIEAGQKSTLPKTPKQLERYLKGVANHRRIEILFLVAGTQGLTVDEISKKLKCNFKTISMHTLRLVQAGLINKKYLAQNVIHSLSPYGKTMYSFLKSFQ